MIDWTTVFESATPEPGASEEEVARLVATLGQPLSPEEIAAVNRTQSNPWPEGDPNHASWVPFDPSRWQMPDRPLPESYLSFVRWSNGGTFSNGSRYFSSMWGTHLRNFLLTYNVPQYMPRALPFSFNGGGVIYMLDMREPAVGDEYPIICASAGCLTFDPYYSPRVAHSLLEVCRGRFNVERLQFGGVVLTAETWPTCKDPEPMLEECAGAARKLRLFACACCRVIWDRLEDRFRQAVELAERYADGKATDKKRAAARQAYKALRGTPGWGPAASAAADTLSSDQDGGAWNTSCAAARVETGESEGPAWEAVRARQADLLREMFGNPFHPVTIDPSWLHWNDHA